MPTKPHLPPFRPITTAPQDVAVEVLHGKRQTVAVASWDKPWQVWVRVGYFERRVLHRVTGWRPLG